MSVKCLSVPLCFFKYIIGPARRNCVMKIILFVTLIFALHQNPVTSFPFPAFSLNSDNEGLIVGGVECTKNEMPFQVSLRVHYLNAHFCGGVILNNLYVLTTAHCGNSYQASSLSVVAGEHNLSADDGTEQLRYVDRIIIHPSYSSSTLANDIALLKLRTPLTLNNAVAAVALAAAGSTPSGNAIVSGWGRTTEGGSMSSILRRVTVPIISDTLCRTYYGSTVIKDSMVCAGESGKDSCQGDSGGPLVIGSSNARVLIGIVSFGYGCGRPNYPGVYTEISHFRTWISQNANLKLKKNLTRP